MDKLKPADVAWLIALVNNRGSGIPTESSDRLKARGFLEEGQEAPVLTEIGRQWLLTNGHLPSRKS